MSDEGVDVTDGVFASIPESIRFNWMEYVGASQRPLTARDGGGSPPQEIFCIPSP